MNIKGSLPLLILQAVEGGGRHGYAIAQQIKSRSKGALDFKEGSLYPTLHQLEQQGWLEAYNEEENGRTRRYYQLTGSGREELARQLKEWKQFVLAVNLALGESL